MADRVRCVLLLTRGLASLVWSQKIADIISRSPDLEGKILELVQFYHNPVWTGKLGQAGYPIKEYAGSLSLYGSDFESIKLVCSAISKETEALKEGSEDFATLWMVGYDEVKINKVPKDSSKPMAKFMGLIMRAPALTVEQFHKYWSEPHAALFCSQPLVHQKVLKYTQNHSKPEWKEDLAKAGLNMAKLEGIVEIYFETLEDLEALFTSTEHVESMMPDEAKFADLEESGILVGTEISETLFPQGPNEVPVATCAGHKLGSG
ncbi:hypothetical protein Mapa_011687 [Marchantia paleacea]|nr:hypothetical protein Mapa_011687 [Marchantia paleacea]